MHSGTHDDKAGGHVPKGMEQVFPGSARSAEEVCAAFVRTVAQQRAAGENPGYPFNPNRNRLQLPSTDAEGYSASSRFGSRQYTSAVTKEGAERAPGSAGIAKGQS